MSPPSSGWAVMRKARLWPLIGAQRRISRASPELAASVTRPATARSNTSLRATASSTEVASVASSQARLAQISDPLAAHTQAGSGMASSSTAKRAAGGRPPSAASSGCRRSQTQAPAERPSTATTPLAPRTWKAQGSPVSNSAARRRRWAGSARVRASITGPGAALVPGAGATPMAQAHRPRASAPQARLAEFCSMVIIAWPKASAEARVASARPSSRATRAR